VSALLSPRHIWLCADDYGMAPGVNTAIRELISCKRLNATSVMVLSPYFDAAAAATLQALSDQTRVAIGLHVTLTAPYSPMSTGFGPAQDGKFLPLKQTMRRAISRRLSPRALGSEIAAQLHAFMEAFGRPPDFVDGHQHVQLLPQVRDAFLQAVSAAAPRAWVRQCGRSARARRLEDRKALLLDILSVGFRRKAAQVGVATNPAFAGTYVFSPKADYERIFPRFLRGLPNEGVIMCHPGIVDAALESIDPLTNLREREFAYLSSDAFPLLLAERGITLGAHLTFATHPAGSS
jgi:predicted glycoside hydrolase/deacetylase ChbG (UPF0249 family)